MHEVKLLSPHFWTVKKNEFANTIYCTPKPAENQITNSVLSALKRICAESWVMYISSSREEKIFFFFFF